MRAALARLLNQCEEAVAAVIVGFDGQMLESVRTSDAIDTPAYSVELAALLAQARNMAAILGNGVLEEAVLRSDKIVLLVRILSDEYLLGIVIRPHGSLGKNRYMTRLAAIGIQSKLTHR